MSGAFGPMKLDFSSFYKFIASVGLVLLAASVVLPWFVLRAAVPDAVEGTDASAVVDVALEARAHQYEFIVHAYPWVSLALFILGCVLTTYGLVAWRKRQKHQDADEDETYRQRRELGRTTPASDNDRQEKLEREVEDSETPADEESRAASSTTTAATSQPAPSSRTGMPKPAHYADRRARLQAIEKQAAELVVDAFSDSHEVETGVRLGAPDAPILDLVARAKDPTRWSSFAMEVKLMAPSPAYVFRIRDVMMAVAIAAREVPEGPLQLGRQGRPPLARSVSICLLLESDDVQGGSVRAFGPRSENEVASRIYRTVSVVNSVLARKVGVITMSEARFATLSPASLRQCVLDVMENPDAMIRLRS